MKSDFDKNANKPATINRVSRAELGIASTTGKDSAFYKGEAQMIAALPEFQKLDSLYQFALNYRDQSLSNRLRHCHDVGDVAAETAKRLGLSEASQHLARAIGLGHDIGHPPFSHWGEKAIEKFVKQHEASWNHDRAGLEILVRAKDGSGAGLSPETIEGLAKRFWRFDPQKALGRGNHSLADLPEEILSKDASRKEAMQLSYLNHLEGQIAAQADLVSFNATDIQDGLRIGRLTTEMLRKHFPAAYETYQEILKDFVNGYRREVGSNFSEEKISEVVVSDPELHGIVFKSFADRFRARLIEDLVQNTSSNLDKAIEAGKISGAQDVREQDGLTADFSERIRSEMREFQRFCRDDIYPKKTAPLEPIVEAVIEKLIAGDIAIKEPYSNQLQESGNPGDKITIIAEYLTREVGDRDLLILAQQHAPDVYEKYFPGYERVEYPSLTNERAYERITKAMDSRHRLGRYIGMPIIHASELDFRPEKSIPVVSKTRKYILPVPEKGETIQIPYTGKKRSGETFTAGEPIFTGKGEVVVGSGIVFYNLDDDQWVVAKCGESGDDRKVFIINEVSDQQARILDSKRELWRDPNNPTVSEIKEMLEFAASIHLVDGLSSEQTDQLFQFVESFVAADLKYEEIAKRVQAFVLERDIVRSASPWQKELFEEELRKLAPSGQQLNRRAIIGAMDVAYGGLKNIYPSRIGYVKQSLPGIPGGLDGSDSPYGYRRRDAKEVFRAVYIDHPFEFSGWDGSPERSYSGAVVIQRNQEVGICQNFRALTSYEHPDGRKLSIDDIPVQRRSFRERYQTNHKVERDIATTVTIVGAGVSGLSTAVHLIKNFPKERLVSHKLILNLIDSATEPAGKTYNRPDANIVGMANPIGVLGIDHSAGCVEYFNQDPERWLKNFPSLVEGYNSETKKFDPRTIITHNQYGEFVRDYFSTTLRELEKVGFPVEVNFIQDKVVSTNDTTVILKSGENLRSDAVVYCVGNALPEPVRRADRHEEYLDGLSGYNRLDDQAWALGNINQSPSTVVLGTANGALFGALWAAGNGYDGKFTLVSRSGTLPERVGTSRPYERQHLTLQRIRDLAAKNIPITANLLKNLFLRELVTAKKRGHEWRDVVDSLASDTNTIWRYLSPDEQGIFQARYMAKWNNARYRIPEHHWEQVEKLIESGRLEIVGGFLGVAPRDEGGFVVRVREKNGEERTIVASKIVNNTGPSKRLEEMPDCIRDMVTKGQARPHHIAGIDVDESFRLIGQDGKTRTGVYAVGPLVSGAHPEAITVPAIRDGAAMLAHSIISDVVAKKELEYRAKIAGEACMLDSPSNDDVSRYVANVIDKKPTGDPRYPNDPGITPTAKLYFREHGPDGVIYTQEREKLHNQIIEQALAGKVAVPKSERPSFVSIAGGMSVGMTYMQRLLMAEAVLDPKRTVVITPLSFRGLPEFDARNHYQHTEKSPLMCQEYYDIVRKIVTRAIGNNLNVMWVDQADALEPLLSLVKAAKEKNYESAMLAMTMTPEAYYRASELWLHKFNRITDHHRGFGDLREFSENWPSFARVFDRADLYETFFNTADIDKRSDDPTRREYTVCRIASVCQDSSGQPKEVVNQSDRYFDFLERGLHINPLSTSPEEARRDYPYDDFRQLSPHAGPNESAGIALSESPSGSLGARLVAFQSDDFATKFVNLVRKTSQARADANSGSKVK